MSPTLYLAWQDPERRLWFPVGRLSREDEFYRFEYLRGALEASRQTHFEPLLSFPDLNIIYMSEQLFPLFANRIMGSSRAEYPQYLNWLDISKADAEPLLVLARGGGHRATDNFEVFAAPELTAEREYRVSFFVHGVRYMPEAARKRAEALEPGERLLLVQDLQNPVEPGALMFRTAEVHGQEDRFLLGHCPRYLLPDLLELIQMRVQPQVRVQRVNPAPAPSQIRVLCELRAQAPAGFVPLSGDIFQSIIPAREAA